MTYGNPAGVAAMTPGLCNSSGLFDERTTPALSTLVSWIAQVDAMIDVAMAAHALPTPATSEAVIAMLGGFCNANVAGLVRGVNGHGKFAAQAKVVNAEELLLAMSVNIHTWVRQNAPGIAALQGATTSTAQTGWIQMEPYNPLDHSVEY